MTKPVWSLTVMIGVLAFAPPGAARAQPAGKEDKPPSPPKVVLPPLDGKLLSDPKVALAAAALLEAAYEGKQPPEGMRMLLTILRGSRMGPGEGWFGPAQTRYTWQWLARLHGIEEKGAIAQKDFRGTDAEFARLDQDEDGRITAQDLVWKRKPPGKKAAGKKPPGKRTESTRAVLLRGLFAGEIGSMNEGPQVGQPAPNFTLKTVDGKETVQLSRILGKKPVVLVFGNYTCRPFTSSYSDVEPVYKRFGKEATFLMVYVREAHPSDGWAMGADIKQPTTFGERESVARRFCKLAKPSIPVLVDEINDPVGHTYSGMPSRLYVIDPRGTVVFKNGRGPFGFKVGEMEQALVMCLLEQRLASR